jgi:hypothetical protein
MPDDPNKVLEQIELAEAHLANAKEALRLGDSCTWTADEALAEARGILEDIKL